jgi:hypothetical protein
MADNKTATLRKQLKIKAGVVKRWAFPTTLPDQIILFFSFSLACADQIHPCVLPYVRFIYTLHTESHITGPGNPLVIVISAPYHRLTRIMHLNRTQARQGKKAVRTREPRSDSQVGQTGCGQRG